MLKSIYAKILRFFEDEPEPQPNEEERILIQIKSAENKLNKAWENLRFATPEYTEIAVLELKLAETEYCLLNRKLRIIQGEPLQELKIHVKFPWLTQCSDKSYTHKGYTYKNYAHKSL